MGTILHCKKALIEQEWISCDILVEDGKVQKIGQKLPQESHRSVDLTNRTVLPGLIDSHIHGYAGHDTMDASQEALSTMSRELLKAGVTSFCPTTMTASRADILRAVSCVAHQMEQPLCGARILGTFAEGPFISEEHRGAQPLDAILPIDFDFLEELVQVSKGTLRKMIIAPEIPQAQEACRWLKERGIVAALGHSSATYEETVRCIECGAGAAVHTFNGMKPFHHREPGITGAVLNRDELYAELIFDTIHVNPFAAQVLYRCRGKDGIALISDCMRAGGIEDGEYMLGDTKTTVKGGVARTEQGNLAGSTLKIIDGVRNAVEYLHIPLEAAVQMASENPAKELSCFDQIGSIAPGKAADLIAIDEEYQVVFAMVNGEIFLSENHIA